MCNDYHRAHGNTWQLIFVARSLGNIYEQYVAVLVDYFSRWPETLTTKDTTSRSVIGWLTEIFARFGIPQKLTSDNGRQFVSKEFSEFLKLYNIEHIRTPPY